MVVIIIKVNIKDVAKKANVSIGTVSRVFNGYSDISEETKRRVLSVAEELNYSPNLSARMLSSKKNNTMAVILSDLEINRAVSLPLDVISGTYQFAEENAYEFYILPISLKKQKEKKLKILLNERNISGAIIQGLKVNDPYFLELENITTPTVLIDAVSSNKNVGSVSINNLQASKEAVEYLIKMGHQKIALINGRREAAVSIDREAGYVQALKSNDIKLRPEYIQYANYNEEIAYLMAIDLIKNYQDITAFFCTSDLMALGVTRALLELNLKIPEDVSVMGFDDIPIVQYTTPTISTIAQDMKLIGYESAKLLDRIIKKKNTVNKQYIPHKIIIRDSTGRIK
ncbi:LacI family DNA-binding transcriptional regulator [Aerococcus urinae]